MTSMVIGEPEELIQNFCAQSMSTLQLSLAGPSFVHFDNVVSAGRISKGCKRKGRLPYGPAPTLARLAGIGCLAL